VTVRRAVALVAVAATVVGVGGVAAHARAVDMLEFRPVISMLPPTSATASSTPGTTEAASARHAVAGCDDVTVSGLSSVPTTPRADIDRGKCVVLAGSDGERYYLGPAEVTTEGIRSARAEFVSGQGWTIELMLTKPGAAAWDELAEQQFQKQVAVVVDGRVLAAPTVQPGVAAFQSFGGIAVISGAFREKQARAVARRIQAASGR